MGWVEMSERELRRAEVLASVMAGRLTVTAAAEVMGVTRRQAHRLVLRFADDGAAGLRHHARGRPSNRLLGPHVRQMAIAYVAENYRDFGPTFASQMLLERHGLSVSRETLRKWMSEEGLWLSRKQRRQFHQPRIRREHFGELVQIDGSEHRWFEDRGPQCTLLVFIDDATSRLMHLQFVTTESTFDYFAATQSYLQRHGKPVAFYSDKHATFRVNKVGATGGNGMTQFGRALDQLNIDIICANVPQAKGRVERANGTLQDRLVKELRLEGISSIEAGNAFLPGFIEDFNRRFAQEPFNEKDLHRPLAGDEDLDEAFAWQEERTVSQSLTLQYDKMLFILEPTPVTRSLARQRVTIYDYPDGRLEIRHQGLNLPYRTFDKLQQVDQAAVVENKGLGPALAYIAERQKELNTSRSGRAPRRQGQGRSIFKAG